MGSLENRVAALEGSAPLVEQSEAIANKNCSMVWQALAREFDDGRKFLSNDHGDRFIAMCKRVEAGHATPDDDRIMAAAVDGWVSMPDFDGREYVLALGGVLADL
jgi:hypothetical protein